MRDNLQMNVTILISPGRAFNNKPINCNSTILHMQGSISKRMHVHFTVLINRGKTNPNILRIDIIICGLSLGGNNNSDVT